MLALTQHRNLQMLDAHMTPQVATIYIAAKARSAPLRPRIVPVLRARQRDESDSEHTAAKDAAQSEAATPEAAGATAAEGVAQAAAGACEGASGGAGPGTCVSDAAAAIKPPAARELRSATPGCKAYRARSRQGCTCCCCRRAQAGLARSSRPAQLASQAPPGRAARGFRGPLQRRADEQARSRAAHVQPRAGAQHGRPLLRSAGAGQLQGGRDYLPRGARVHPRGRSTATAQSHRATSLPLATPQGDLSRDTFVIEEGTVEEWSSQRDLWERGDSAGASGPARLVCTLDVRPLRTDPLLLSQYRLLRRAALCSA